MSDHPYISVVTPVLNGGKTIERTLQSLSVQRAIFEHIVYDGGSTDNTREIVRKYAGQYPLQLIEGANLGVYGNVANGHRLTKGEIMGWINADDFYMPWTLATVQRIFEQNPDVHWITGIPSWYFENQSVSTTASIAPVWPRWAIRRGLASSNLLGFIQQESIFWRRGLWEKAAPDDLLNSYRYAADFHLWRRFAEHARLRTVSTVFACFTISDNQFSGKCKAQYLKECGVKSGTYQMGWSQRLLSRLVSTVLFSQVLKVTRLAR